MDAAIFRPGPIRASTEDSYLVLRRIIKAIRADFQRISRKGLKAWLSSGFRLDESTPDYLQG
jgi:hypothetical protein